MDTRPHVTRRALAGLLGGEFEVRRAARERGEFCLFAGPRAALLRGPWQAAKLWPGSIEEANGFLNFRMNDAFLIDQCRAAAAQGARFGGGSALAGRRVNVEFVSSDPTGPLSLAAGRVAAAGEALCRLLEFQGANVTREFFVNDVPNSSKLRLLGESVGAFYAAEFGQGGELPEGIEQSDFVRGVAKAIAQRDGNAHLLEPEALTFFARRAATAAVELQRESLRGFGVRFDVWTSENYLRAEGRVDAAIEKLTRNGHTYEQGGALWLRSTAFGDDADRPLTRQGQPTYLAGDIAYHLYKFERGFDVILDIWNAEHRPYVARTRAGLQAVGCDETRWDAVICQGARLQEDGEPMKGAAQTLDGAMAEMDADALRFFSIQAGWEAACDIDLETATRDDERNPAYAARLLPARLATMIRENEVILKEPPATEESPQLHEAERNVARLVALWPDTTENAATRREPHQAAQWILETASAVRELLAAPRPEDNSPTRLTVLRGAQAAASAALGILGIEAKNRL